MAAALAAGVALSSGAIAQDKPKLTFVVNASSDFWKLAEAGVKKAQAELPNYELEFKYPAQGTAALQNALMDDLVAAGTDAIMISSADRPISSLAPAHLLQRDRPVPRRALRAGGSQDARDFAELGGVRSREV